MWLYFTYLKICQLCHVYKIKPLKAADLIILHHIHSSLQPFSLFITHILVSVKSFTCFLSLFNVYLTNRRANFYFRYHNQMNAAGGVVTVNQSQLWELRRKLELNCIKEKIILVLCCSGRFGTTLYWYQESIWEQPRSTSSSLVFCCHCKTLMFHLVVRKEGQKHDHSESHQMWTICSQCNIRIFLLVVVWRHE